MFACNLIPFEPIIFKKAVYQIKIPQHNQKILILYQRNVSLQKYQFKNSNTTMLFHDFVFLTLANPGQPPCSITVCPQDRYKKRSAVWLSGQYTILTSNCLAWYVFTEMKHSFWIFSSTLDQKNTYKKIEIHNCIYLRHFVVWEKHHPGCPKCTAICTYYKLSW